MKQLKFALDNLVSLHATHQLTGSFCKSDYFSLNFDSLSYSPELVYYFTYYNPLNIIFEIGSLPKKFLSIQDIDENKDDPLTNKILIGSSDDKIGQKYIVLIEEIEGGSPIVASLDKNDQSIYVMYARTKLYKIANSLTEFIQAFSKLVDITYSIFGTYFDTSYATNDQFTETMIAEIKPFLGDDEFENFYDYFCE